MKWLKNLFGSKPTCARPRLPEPEDSDEDTNDPSQFLNLLRIPGFGNAGSGNFGLVQVLGQRGTARVVEVLDLRTHRSYALKVMPKSVVSAHSFYNEVEIHYLLQGHKNIIPMEAAFQDIDFFYVLMPKAEGTLGNADGLPGFQDVMKQVLQAVQHCHKKNVLHRDIKPDNFLVSRDGKVQLTDFGSALRFKNASARAYGGMGAPGTVAFAAPEVRCVSGMYGLKSDMYSVGVTMYALLRGEAEEEMDPVTDLLSPSPAFMKTLSKACSQLILNLLSHQDHIRLNAKKALSHEWFQTRLA